MKCRTLGRTGLKVSEVGMGTWQLANDPNCWVGSDLNESLKTLSKFVELGGNFIDTAWVYGWDDTQSDRHPSEELIGKFLKESGKRRDLIIATKVPPKNMQWPALKGVPISEVFPDDWIVKCVDDSLKSLGVDTIDVMQFHVWQDDFVDQDEWKEIVQKTIQEGKVRFWGVSVNDYQPSNCFRAIETGLISTIQFIFNVFYQKPAKKLLLYARKNNIGLIARVPLDEGGLSGKITLETTFAQGDFRRHYFAGDRLQELVKRTAGLKDLLDGEAKTLPELSLRYILSWDEVSTVIPGMRRLAHVDANTAVSDGRRLSAQLLAQLKQHAWERNFYSGLDPWLKNSNFVET